MKNMSLTSRNLELMWFKHTQAKAEVCRGLWSPSEWGGRPSRKQESTPSSVGGCKTDFRVGRG